MASTSPTDSSPSDSGNLSSSTTSSRYDLDENDRSAILVYSYRKGLSIESQHDLSQILNKEPTPLRVSRKPIPRGDSCIEVFQEDLYPEPLRLAYRQYPNMKSSLASIALPRRVYWRRLLLDQYRELFIVSPESSPEGSVASSAWGGASCEGGKPACVLVADEGVGR